MSRRKERARDAGAKRPETGAARPETGAAQREAGAEGAAPRWPLRTQIALLIAVFAVVTLVAELAGAANLGVALGIGQIAFAIAAMYVLMRS